jgi:DNA-directed RNA polymerase subunit H (RpoH/RPB5)
MSQKATNSETIANIFNSRKIILELARRRGFNTENYEHFSIHEIGLLYTNKQLDMFLKNEETGNKIYYKYHLQTKIRPANVLDYVEDLFNIEEILEPHDELIIITKDKPNDSLLNILDKTYKKQNLYINIYNLHTYLYNILDNVLVPPHRVISEEEKQEIMKKYNVTEEKLLPEIGRFDPVAIAIGLRPSQVTEIIRSSQTSLTAKYYRLCI